MKSTWWLQRGTQCKLKLSRMWGRSRSWNSSRLYPRASSLSRSEGNPILTSLSQLDIRWIKMELKCLQTSSRSKSRTKNKRINHRQLSFRESRTLKPIKTRVPWLLNLQIERFLPSRSKHSLQFATRTIISNSWLQEMLQKTFKGDFHASKVYNLSHWKCK